MKNPFVQKPKFRIEVGGFIASFFFKENDINNTFLRIETVSGVWSMRLDGRTHPFGYLYTAVSQGDETQIHGYAALMYRTAMALTQSQGFVEGLNKEINKLDKRLMKRAESEAAKIDETTEQANQAFMEDIASEQGLSKKELKAKREADREAMREVLKEIKEDKS